MLRSNAAPELAAPPAKAAVRGLSPGGLGAGLLLLYALPKTIARPAVTVGVPANDVAPQDVTGTASADLSPFGVDATGTAPAAAVTGTADAALSPFAAASTGAETFASTASSALSPFAAASAGTLTFSATATAALSPFTASAVVAETFAGAASAALSPFAASATGAETFAGMASGALSPFAATSAATLAYSGAAAAAMSPFGADALAALAFAGDAASALAAFSADAVGAVRVGVEGVGAAALSPFAAQAYGPLGGSPPYAVALAGVARSVSVAAPASRAASVTMSGRTAPTVDAPVRSVALTTARRSVALSLRGIHVAVFSIFQGDSAPSLDVQLLAAGVPVVLTGASVVGELAAEGATTTSAFTLAIVDEVLGKVRRVWSAGETQALAAGAYRLRIKVTFADTSIVTYPDPQQSPISLRVVAP